MFRGYAVNKYKAAYVVTKVINKGVRHIATSEQNRTSRGGVCYQGRLTVITRSQKSQTRVEAGSNNSIVTQRVVGVDEQGSLRSETIKYGHESKALGTKKDHAGECQQHRQKADPSSRQRGRPTKKKKTGP
jgi:hypothetical protein